jgi:hypothetical protein
MMRLGALVAALLLTACQPMPQQAGASPTQEPSWEVDTTDVPPPVRVPETVLDADACRARGGELRQIGRMQTPSCVIRYADAGKRCTDGSQCQGDCRAEADLPPPGRTPAAPGVLEGRCQADSNPFGCHTRLENGQAVTLCVD